VKKYYTGSYKNYYENSNGNYVVCCGTFFYKDLFSKEAFSALLNDFFLKDFHSIEQNIIGHFLALPSLVWNHI